MNTDRSINVLKHVFSGIFEFEAHFSPSVPVCVIRQANAARCSQAFKTCGNVHAVAIDIVILNDDVTEVDTNAKLQRTFTFLRRALVDAILPGRCTIHSIHDTGKLHQKSITNEFYHPSAMLGDQR